VVGFAKEILLKKIVTGVKAARRNSLAAKFYLTRSQQGAGG